MVKASLRMIPRLVAEESLLEAHRIAYGTGSLEKDAARATWRQWQDAAGMERRRPPRATTETLAALGIGVHQVPVTGQPE